MSKVFRRVLLAAALVATLPAAALAQDDAPQSLETLALQFVVQAEQIDRLHERIDNIRIGTLRDRIKALEVATDELRGQFAAAPLAFVSATLDHDQETCA